MKRGVWFAILAASVSALITRPALAVSAVAGTWDVAATAVARYRYEGRPRRIEVPFGFVVSFEDDGSYSAGSIHVSCQPDGVTLPEVRGTWRLGRGGRIHATPSLVSAFREGTEACVAGTRASVLTSHTRMAVAGEANRLEGVSEAVLRVRYREGDETEHVRVRVVVTLAGTRRVE